jgi:hypothetical protein
VAPGLGLAGAAVVLVVLVWSLGAPFRASGPGLSLAWATAEPWATEGGSTLVEMRLVVDNDGRQHTQSTSILWEPAFASRFTLISSDPPAWRVRIDERGWGVLDTAGLLPSRSGTFRLWFSGPPAGGPAGGPAAPAGGAAGGAAVVPPRVMVVANGHFVIAETAADVRRLDGVRGRAPATFERGPLAAAADAFDFVPADARGAFPFAAATGLLLGAVLAAGGVAAARASAPR